jgi:acetyl esterase/lipase
MQNIIKRTNSSFVTFDIYSFNQQKLYITFFVVFIFFSAPHLLLAYSPYSKQIQPKINVVHNVRYGDKDLETFDVYVPSNSRNAPVIFMVHGGGWRHGDKANKSFTKNKVSHWVPHGIIVISVNYPLLHTTPIKQAHAVAKALAAAQHEASQWGGNPKAFVLLGHSAGAYLVSLVSTDPTIAASYNVLPWLGTISLDTAAYDVVKLMNRHHLSLYDDAFGSDSDIWKKASPALQLKGKIPPFLTVCSSKRIFSCSQAYKFAQKARGFGSPVKVLPVDMTHREINIKLGLPSDYTTSVDKFLKSLGTLLSERLS